MQSGMPLYTGTNVLYLLGLIFAVHESTQKTTKIGPLKNFPNSYNMILLTDTISTQVIKLSIVLLYM